jgi:hypothetical protein
VHVPVSQLKRAHGTPRIIRLVLPRLPNLLSVPRL